MSIWDFIKRQITRYRDRLANLSRKNKELYYRESRGHCINLTSSPNIEPAYSEIIAEKFNSLRCFSSKFQDFLNNAVFDLDQHFLIEDTQNAQLIKRLDKVRLADKKFRREFGIPGAWILGPFLCWRLESQYQPEDLLISPIFKMAVSIEKNKKKWSLNLEDSVLTLNPSLRLALRLKCGIDLPEVFESESIEGALKELENCLTMAGKKLVYESRSDSIPKMAPRYKVIKDEHGEIVDRLPTNIIEHLSKEELQIYNQVTNQQFVLMDIVYIDHLNASRISLLRDYDKILDDAEMHPILSELFLGKAIPFEKGEEHARIKELDVYRENENYFVVNADSAQHRAIDQTNKSRAVVIQGPPGTGKSQTITNLISDCLSKGKKVLFVSEKRAALDVVHSRLQQANLAAQSVLIHSSDLNKQSLYNSFLELSNSVHDEDTDKQWDLITAELDQCKIELNKYYNILETKHATSDLLISELFSLSSQVSPVTLDSEIIAIFSMFSYTQICQLCILIDDLESAVNKVPAFATHPWLHRKPTTVYTESFAAKISTLVNNIKNTKDMINLLQEKIFNMGVEWQCSAMELNGLQKIAKSAIPPEWISFLQKFHLNPHENLAYQQSFYKIVTTISNLKDNCNQFRYNSDINIQEIKKLDSYYDSNRSLMDCFTPNFWKMRGLRNKYLKNWDGTNGAFKSYLLMHDEILNFKSNQQNNSSPFIINELNPQSLLDAYSIILPMLQTMDDLNNVIVKLFPAVKEKFERLSIETCSEIVKLFETVIATKDQVNALEAKIIDMYEQLNFYFEIPHDFSFENNEVFENLLRTIIDIDSIDAIDLCLVKMNNVISKQMIIDKLLHIDLKWSQYIHDNVIKSWVDEIRSLYPELRTFDKNSFHKKIKQFVTLEDDHRNSARDFVNNTLFKRWNKGAGEFEGLSLLKKEANKRNKVIPPREILEKGAASTMFKLKPCWLMSPLSISQILPLEMGLFDTIIFDEASQVRVEDAIPAIYRANSMVVVGDMKQMPPTNFFSGSDSTDDDDEEETVELSSSILDLAAQIYPSEILEWHYRSRSEALIAYSNRAFYGGRLIAVPNPNYITEGDVIKFHIVNNAYFTQNDGNSTEAEAIVDRLSQLLKNEPNRSFGIIALGQTQMLAIEDAIERKRSSDLAFQKAIEKAENHMEGEVDAGLFVKNLENVQGDERDIIIISVGYAAANPNRKVYMNFGPLSKVGGGCRLNVAITRAKHKIEVFCSFDPNLISTEEADFSRNPDLVLFGRYLKYTKAISEKSHTEALSILNSFGIGGVITSRKSSNFSKNVKKRLEELGYQVSAEVGSSGFYIDLAIHHPVIQTNFVLGIECDGAIFHSTPYARDRDKIRQELLESRGWKIARVWSQDWSRNWQAEIAKLDLELKEIISS